MSTEDKLNMSLEQLEDLNVKNLNDQTLMSQLKK